MQISDVTIPEELGYVTETHAPTPASSHPAIIVQIQEAHTNYDAQQHVIGILEALIERHGLKLILVEGGEGDVGLAYLRRYGPPDNRREVAGKYLKAGIISGEEYLDIVSDHPLVLWGVEQEALYHDNFEALMELEALRDAVAPLLAAVRQAAETLRTTLFSDELRGLEAKADAYRQQQMGLAEYVGALVSLADHQGLALHDAYPNLHAFHAARELESAIRPTQVQQEQQALIKQLSGVADEHSLQELVADVEALNAGQITREQFYATLQQLADSSSVSLESYPNLATYLRYVSATARMDPRRLAEEVDQLAGRLREPLALTPASRTFLTLLEQLEIMEQLLAARLSPQEYEALTAWDLEQLFATWRTFLTEHVRQQGLPSDSWDQLQGLAATVVRLRRFYEVALQRDQVLVDNAVAKLHETGEPLAVLITGGFHAPQITRLLTAQGFGVVVVTPKISQPTNQELYHAVLRYKNGQGSLEDVMATANESTGSATVR